MNLTDIRTRLIELDPIAADTDLETLPAIHTAAHKTRRRTIAEGGDITEIDQLITELEAAKGSVATATINMITEIVTIDADGETHQLPLNPPTANTLHITIAGNSPIVRADTVAAHALGYRRVGEWHQPGFHPTAEFEPHPARCDACVNGCRCTTDSEGCGHLGCWGRTDAICPGIAAHHPEAGAPAGTSWTILGARWALTDKKGKILALVTNTGINEERNGVFAPQYRVSVGADVEITDGYELAIDLANAKVSELLVAA